MSYFYSTCFTVPKLQVELEAAKQRELELLAVIKKQRNGLNAVESLIGDSEGVSGLHLNGDIAEWSSLRTGGSFEDWLVDFDSALECEPSQALREHEAKVIAEYKQDAERYRWVRDECTAEKSPQHTWIVESPGDLWDAAIDAAMAEERRKN